MMLSFALMVITRTNSASIGADNLEYNFLKVQEGTATIISSQGVRLRERGELRPVSEVTEDFLRHVPLDMRTTVRPVTHLTLNPDPQDAVSPGELRALMMMTLGELEVHRHAHVAFLHQDTGRLHAHAVFLRLSPDGVLRKLRATYDLSHALTRKLGLEPMHPALKAKVQMRLAPVRIQEPELTAQMRGVLLLVRRFYTPCCLEEYQSVLECFNIRCTQVRGTGGERLHYQALDDMGQPRSMAVPIQRLGYRNALGQVEEFLDTNQSQMLSDGLGRGEMDSCLGQLVGPGRRLQETLEGLYAMGVQVLLLRDRLSMVSHREGWTRVLDPVTSDRLLQTLTRAGGLDDRRQTGFLLRDFYLQRRPLQEQCLPLRCEPVHKRLTASPKWPETAMI